MRLPPLHFPLLIDVSTDSEDYPLNLMLFAAVYRLIWDLNMELLV